MVEKANQSKLTDWTGKIITVDSSHGPYDWTVSDDEVNDGCKNLPLCVQVNIRNIPLCYCNGFLEWHSL